MISPHIRILAGERSPAVAMSVEVVISTLYAGAVPAIPIIVDSIKPNELPVSFVWLFSMNSESLFVHILSIVNMEEKERRVGYKNQNNQTRSLIIFILWTPRRIAHRTSRRRLLDKVPRAPFDSPRT
jgi:hypothetical protein